MIAAACPLGPEPPGPPWPSVGMAPLCFFQSLTRLNMGACLSVQSTKHQQKVKEHHRVKQSHTDIQICSP